MAVYKTRLSSDIKPRKIVDKLHHLEGKWTEGDPHRFLVSQLGEEHSETGKAHLDQLGTLGGGDHFAEFCCDGRTSRHRELCDSLGLVDNKHLLDCSLGLSQIRSNCSRILQQFANQG